MRYIPFAILALLCILNLYSNPYKEYKKLTLLFEGDSTACYYCDTLYRFIDDTNENDGFDGDFWVRLIYSRIKVNQYPIKDTIIYPLQNPPAAPFRFNDSIFIIIDAQSLKHYCDSIAKNDWDSDKAESILDWLKERENKNVLPIPNNAHIYEGLLFKGECGLIMQNSKEIIKMLIVEDYVTSFSCGKYYRLVNNDSTPIIEMLKWMK